MKILYAGTPDFAIPPLQGLLDAGYPIVGVVTQMDKPQGRKGVLTPPPVKTFAQSRGLEVF
jgi:methionyl-tRNA formyltransferase